MKHTPEPWKVRTHPDLGSFIEAPVKGKPYGQEILGDDYFDELDKEADCHRIVACINACAGLTEDEIKEAISAWNKENP